VVATDQEREHQAGVIGPRGSPRRAILEMRSSSESWPVTHLSRLVEIDAMPEPQWVLRPSGSAGPPMRPTHEKAEAEDGENKNGRIEIPGRRR